MTRVGIYGVGRMGLALGERVLAGGFALTVANRTPERAKPLLDLGADLAAGAAELASRCDIVITPLSDDAAVHDVYQEFLTTDVTGTLFVEASTIRTATELRLAAAVQAAGATFVDAPMAGPPAAARAGKLMLFTGGEPSDVDRARPVLSTFADRIVHMGPTGSGTTMKLVLMSTMGTYFSALAEGLAMGAQLGLDRAAMLDVIMSSHGAPPAARDRAPLLLSDSEESRGFEVSGVRKDLSAIVATGQDAGVPMAMATSALNMFAAASAFGYADRDLVFVVDYVRELAERSYPNPTIR